MNKISWLKQSWALQKKNYCGTVMVSYGDGPFIYNVTD